MGKLIDSDGGTHEFNDELELRAELHAAARRMFDLTEVMIESEKKALSAEEQVKQYRPGRRSEPAPPQYVWLLRRWMGDQVVGVFRSPAAYLKYNDRVGKLEVNAEAREQFLNLDPEASYITFTEWYPNVALVTKHVMVFQRIEVIDG